MKKKTKRVVKPIDARTLEDICSMPRDTLDSKGFWIMVDEGRITITQQNVGESPTAQIHVPKAQFDRMARWYVTGKASK
jgi:hypothetical protein